MIDTIHGAKSSAIIYSIVETAKANNLKPFDYVQYRLEEIPKHMDDRDCSFFGSSTALVRKTSGRNPQSTAALIVRCCLKYLWLQSSHLKSQGTRCFSFT